MRLLENTYDESGKPIIELSRTEVIKRLRSRSQPIQLFGETEKETLMRLRRLEIEQPDMKEGWKNDFQTALQEVDDELLKEVIEGTQNAVGKHDIVVDDDMKDFEEIRELAKLLGTEDNVKRDCDTIYAFLNVSNW